MKKIFTLCVASLLILTPFSKVNSNPLPDRPSCMDFDLGAPDIYYYLVNLGYTVYGQPSQNGNNWLVRTSFGSAQYWTTVFTDGTSITGHEDIGI
jgi:hypothetical protein